MPHPPPTQAPPPRPVAPTQLMDGVWRWLVRLALLAGLAWGGEAAAYTQPCLAQISGLSQVAAAGGYDPYASLPPPVYNTFTVQLLYGSACRYAIGMTNGYAWWARRMFGWNGNWLSYDLYRDAALTQRITDINTGDVQGLITGMLNPGSKSQQTVAFYSSVAAGQLVPPGAYYDAVMVNLYQMDQFGNIVALLDSEAMQVRASVRSAIQATIQAGGMQTPLAGALATLNFGPLSSGATGSFEVDVSGNTGYTLSIQSANGGKMLNTEESTAPGISYSLSMDGRGLNPAALNSISYSMVSTLDRHQFLVTIGDVTHVLAGTYSDSLLVTVTAN